MRRAVITGERRVAGSGLALRDGPASTSMARQGSLGAPRADVVSRRVYPMGQFLPRIHPERRQSLQFLCSFAAPAEPDRDKLELTASALNPTVVLAGRDWFCAVHGALHGTMHA